MKQILLHDKEHERSTKLKSLLEQQTLNVVIPKTMEEMTELLRHGQLQSIIMDIEEAEREGLDCDLLARYHEDTSIPVFFIISDPDSKFSPVNYDKAIDDIVLKPYREQEVALRVINRLKNLKTTEHAFGEIQRMNILFKVHGLPYQSIELDEIASSILNMVTSLYTCESAAIFMKNEEEQAQLVASIGPVNREDLESIIGVTTRTVLDQRMDMFYQDLYRELYWGSSNWKNPEYLRNAICMPLTTDGKIIGDIELYNLPAEMFTDGNGDIVFLERIASEAARVLNLSSQFSRVHRDLQFAADELSIMYEISDALSSTLNLDELLKLIVRKATKSFDAQVVSLMMLNEEKSELSIRFADGISDEIIRKTKVKLGDGVAGRVAQTGQPLLLVDVMGVEIVDLNKNMKSALCVPLKINDHVIGVLNVSKNSRYRFTESDLKLCFNLASLASQAIEKAELYSDIKNSLEEIKSSYMSTVHALSKAIEAKDPYTQGHVDRVAKYGMAIALEMDPELLKDDMFRYALVLHDIGKIQIPDAILAKTGKLTREEMEIMRQHPETGAKILQPVKFLQKAAEMVRYHQERWDGKGYPQGLKGDEIPLAARIISVADAFDAITSDRPYRKAQGIEHAKSEILKASGSQFDPAVVKAFFSALDKKVIP